MANQADDDNVDIHGDEKAGVPEASEAAPMTEDEYSRSFKESLEQTLDLDTWHIGGNLLEIYERLRTEVAEAVRQEREVHRTIRDKIFPMLRTRDGAPSGAGVFRADPDRIADVHSKILFNGGVDACDGTVVSHDTLPVTITQIGVCLVSYRGDQGSWMHRLFRRDLRATGMNPVDETMEMLERRRSRSAVGMTSHRDRLSSLARRGIMAYAERAVLLDRATAPWRMGHGSPTPYELVAGSGMVELVRSGLTLMRRLVLEHKRFIFVPSATNRRELLTIGNALEPLEYAIVDTNKEALSSIAGGHFRGEGWGDVAKDVDKFVDEVGPQVAVGMYRASLMSPAQVFYSHVDHAHEAAMIAIADSVLQEHRGFPMLIDLADGICTSTFGADIFAVTTEMAYSEAGAPFQFMAERRTRK